MNDERDPFAEFSAAWAKFWKVAVVDPLTPFVRWLAARPEWQLWSFVACCWLMFAVFLARAVAHQ